MKDNVYTSTPEIYQALSSTSNTGKSIKKENDILLVNNNENDLNYTGVGDKLSKRKTFLTLARPKLFDDNRNKTFDDNVNYSDNVEGEGIEKIIVPSNIINYYTRLEIFFGLKLSGHTNTLFEASNLIDTLYK